MGYGGMGTRGRGGGCEATSYEVMGYGLWGDGGAKVCIIAPTVEIGRDTDADSLLAAPGNHVIILHRRILNLRAKIDNRGGIR